MGGNVSAGGGIEEGDGCCFLVRGFLPCLFSWGKRGRGWERDGGRKMEGVVEEDVEVRKGVVLICGRIGHHNTPRKWR